MGQISVKVTIFVLAIFHMECPFSIKQSNKPNIKSRRYLKIYCCCHHSFFFYGMQYNRNIVTELIRPIDFRKMVFSRHLGDTLVKIAFCCIPVSIIAMVIMPTHILYHTQFFLGVLSIILAYCIQFLYSLIIGLLSFWLIVTWPLNMFLGAVYKLLSGVWIPVTMFPDLLFKINQFLPFRAIYAIPVTILTQRMESQTITAALTTQVIWILLLYFITDFIWIIGKRKLIVQGG